MPRPTPNTRACGFATAAQVREMYDQVDPRNGRRVWSMREVAEKFNIGESTIQRIIAGAGAYRGLDRAGRMPDDLELAESAQRVARMAAQIEAERALHPDGDEMLKQVVAEPAGYSDPKGVVATVKRLGQGVLTRLPPDPDGGYET